MKTYTAGYPATLSQKHWINTNKQGKEANTMKIQSEKDLEVISNEYRQIIYHPEATKVNIGMASCGIAAGAQDAFDKATENYNGNKDVQISQSGCIGFCEMEPLVEIFQDGKPRVMYKNITEKKIVDAIEDYREGISQKNGSSVRFVIPDPFWKMILKIPRPRSPRTRAHHSWKTFLFIKIR